MHDHSHFATTQWTLVWQAKTEDAEDGKTALAELMKRYWRPLYSYGRRQGLSVQDAEDATQDFMGRILSGKLLENADPAKGKFRTYLLTAWKRFLIDQYRHQQTQKHGGHERVVNLSGAETEWTGVATRAVDADHAFMLSWAQGLLAQTREQLLSEYLASDKGDLAFALLPYLSQPLEQAQAEQLGQRCSLTVGAAKVALHRFRQRYGHVLRSLVAETVDGEADVDSEIEDLLAVLSRHGMPDS